MFIYTYRHFVERVKTTYTHTGTDRDELGADVCAKFLCTIGSRNHHAVISCKNSEIFLSRRRASPPGDRTNLSFLSFGFVFVLQPESLWKGDATGEVGGVIKRRLCGEEKLLVEENWKSNPSIGVIPRTLHKFLGAPPPFVAMVVKTSTEVACPCIGLSSTDSTELSRVAAQVQLSFKSQRSRSAVAMDGTST
jgi:hypothetical protein